MRIRQVIDNLTDWLNQSVCPEIMFKTPNDEATASCSREQHPVAYPLYVPGEGKLPDESAFSAPSINVQLLKGKDNLLQRSRDADIQLTLSIWNPGSSTGEMFYPQNPGAGPRNLRYRRHEEDFYTRNLDGYKDIINFTDHVLDALEKTEIIKGVRVVKEEPVEFGQFQTDGVIWDDYPYWHMWIIFKVEAGTSMTIPEPYKNLL